MKRLIERFKDLYRGKTSSADTSPAPTLAEQIEHIVTNGVGYDPIDPEGLLKSTIYADDNAYADPANVTLHLGAMDAKMDGEPLDAFRTRVPEILESRGYVQIRKEGSYAHPPGRPDMKPYEFVRDRVERGIGGGYCTMAVRGGNLVGLLPDDGYVRPTD